MIYLEWIVAKELINMPDFDEVKAKVPITEALARLGIELKPGASEQLRGVCPLCDDGKPRSFVVTPSRNLFYAFCCKQGGDQLSLVAKVKGMSLKDAANWLVKDTAPKQTAPQEQEPSKSANSGFHELDYLEADHPAVLSLGLNPAAVKELGGGYAPKGVARGNVLLPVRDRSGTLIGYVGVEELTYIPPTLHLAENVVPMKKPA